MFKSVFHRIMLASCTITLSVIVLITIAMNFLLNSYATESKYNSVIDASKTIEGMTVTLLYNEYNTQSRYYYDTSLVAISKSLGSDITVIQENGEVFTSTNQTKKVSPDYVSSVLAGDTITKRGSLNSSYDDRFYIVGVPLKYYNQIVGGVFFDTELPKLQNNVSGIFTMFLLVCVIALIFAYILIYIQTKKTVAPLLEINKAVLEIASGNFSKRLKPGKDEIGQIASSFNYMAASLEKLEKMRSEFVSDISHELRTPMTSISGFISGILDGTIPPEKEREYLKIVYDESKRLAKLTNDMLEMSKMTSSEYKLDVSKFNINELVGLCIIQLEQKITDKGLDLDVNLPDGKLMVLADKGSIQRVIINILDNAIKFSFKDTTIKVSVTKKATKAYISIGNLGIGIEEKDLENIFDRFYKTDKSRSKDTSGAGLGLALAKNIINLHNQEIWVESVKTGKNSRFTTFTFTIELS